MITPANGAEWITNRYRRPITWYGLSTDTKPAENVVNGSAFIEMDTGKLFFYDQAGGTWLEWGG